MATSYKPSPLSYGSPRASPFRRPESPASPSPLRHSTPVASRAEMAAPATTTPSRLNRSSTPQADGESWTPRGLAKRESETSPTKGANSPGFGGMLTARTTTTDNNVLSKLQPAQIRELREGFSVLDRDSDGQVGREDVADMLTQLGLPANTSDVTAFFPSSSSQTVTLPTFLNSLASLLASLSPPSELLSAFSAFDEDDSGQVDLAELRDALLHTAPEPGEKPLTEREVDKVMNGFTGRRAFGKHTMGHGGMGMGVSKRGEVFKYQEFVANVAGGASVDGKEGRGSDE
ncbi:related to myosin regulatory light chain 1 [Phialocephala subalpina]|uniref:Related to myosin regulatory light chain 1 n=1 Tax=Phialocephala subalpina TaxID=576137 RepID=A0A1L7WNI7_9HELO|nr:related to myosin regulatory light chain 1 [Phialocephala subalpina]